MQKMHVAYMCAFKMQHFTKNAWIAAWPWRDCIKRDARKRHAKMQNSSKSQKAYN